MPSEGDPARRWLVDIRHHIVLAREFSGGLPLDAFQNDLLRLYAVTRCLEIISEASRRLPDFLKSRHPGIEWRRMAAAGNVYRHDYEDAEPSLVWMTLTTALPPLLAVVEAELADRQAT